MAELTWAVLQPRDGELDPQSLETIAAAQRLAELAETEVEAVVLGDGIGEIAEELAATVELAAVRIADAASLGRYRPGVYCAALAPALREHRPRFVLFPHTYQSMDYFPRLAQRHDAAIVPGVERFDGRDGELRWRRRVLGGKLEAEVRANGEGPVFASIQSAAFAADAVIGGSSEVIPLDVEIDGPESDREIVGVEQAATEEVDLSQADVIVAVGRGVGGEENMGVIEELAAALGADIGASRPVIDSGWLPRDRQIGSSGQTVAPKLYIAAGISGAIQHLVGMKGSGCIVAINKDPNAPIFSVSDYGIVGDLHEVLPALTAAIRDLTGS